MATGKMFEDLAVGEEVSITRVVTPDDLIVFAHVSGNLNPMNLPGSPGAAEGKVGHPAPSMWLGSLFSAVLGNLLPGPGTLYVGQTLRFGDRAHVGDTLTVRVTRDGQRPPRTVIAADALLRGEEVLVDGEAEVLAPETRIALPESALPGVLVARHQHLERLLAAVGGVAAAGDGRRRAGGGERAGGALAGMRAQPDRAGADRRRGQDPCRRDGPPICRSTARGSRTPPVTTRPRRVRWSWSTKAASPRS